MLINKMVMVDIPGHALDLDTRAHLERYQPGGVILFRKNIQTTAQTRALTDELRTILGPDVLIAIDQEGGGVWRTSDLPTAPSAMNVGAANDLQNAFDVGAMIARGMRAMGLNWDFAPVMDVNNNPFNPVIAERSFGENPERVAELALAYADGLMSEGVAPCAKHFPGHGDTALDSHHALPTVTRNLEGLEEYELVPFREAAAHHLPAIMTAHIIYPAMDPELPATLSRKILTGLLRERGGFKGVIITDSMGMDAIDKNWGRAEAAVMSVLAGSDMLEALGSRTVQVQTFEALEKAAQDGTISSARVNESLERLSSLARRFPSAPADYAPEREAADRGLAVNAWGRGIVAYRDPVIPRPGSHIVLIAAEGVPGENVAEAGLDGAELARQLSGVYEVQPVLYDLYNPLGQLEAVRAVRASGKLVVFAATSRLRLSADACTLAAAAQPDLTLALWNPYAVLDVDSPALITFGYRPEGIEALLRVLRGEAQAIATAPIRL
jgi:beta-N-acetylhexosaminidase